MPSIPYIAKAGSLYLAYASEFDVVSYGTCRDEALNNLALEIREYREAAQEIVSKSK